MVSLLSSHAFEIGIQGIFSIFEWYLELIDFVLLFSAVKKNWKDEHVNWIVENKS